MRLSSIIFFNFYFLCLISCSKSDQSLFTAPTLPTTRAMPAGLITGSVKGTMISGKTYTVAGDIIVEAGDTLASQQGVTVIMQANVRIIVKGVLQLVGTREQPIFIRSEAGLPGGWKGILADNAQAITLQWVEVNQAGTSGPAGEPGKTLFVNAPIKVDIEDCWFIDGQGDQIKIQSGAMVSILRNSFYSSGKSDGDAIHVAMGISGDIAYNVVFNQAGSGIRIENNSPGPVPAAPIYVYNNTFVSNGWRTGFLKPGGGISIGPRSNGIIYNNLLVNNYRGIDISKESDLAHTLYGNNYFYASLETCMDTTVIPGLSVWLRYNFYPSGGGGSPRPTDLISAGINDLNPLFNSFDGTVSAPYGASYYKDFHLQDLSPALGIGNPLYSLDIGAYTQDPGRTNRH